MCLSSGARSRQRRLRSAVLPGFSEGTITFRAWWVTRRCPDRPEINQRALLRAPDGLSLLAGELSSEARSSEAATRVGQDRSTALGSWPCAPGALCRHCVQLLKVVSGEEADRYLEPAQGRARVNRPGRRQDQLTGQVG